MKSFRDCGPTRRGVIPSAAVYVIGEDPNQPETMILTCLDWSEGCRVAERLRLERPAVTVLGLCPREWPWIRWQVETRQTRPDLYG